MTSERLEAVVVKKKLLFVFHYWYVKIHIPLHEEHQGQSLQSRLIQSERDIACSVLSALKKSGEMPRRWFIFKIFADQAATAFNREVA